MMAKFAEQLADSGKITDSVEISGYIKELCLGRPFLPFKYGIKLNFELSRKNTVNNCREVSNNIFPIQNHPDLLTFFFYCTLLDTLISNLQTLVIFLLYYP